MIVDVKQGVIRPYYIGKNWQDIPTYLQVKNRSVIINTNSNDYVILSFSHGSANYLFMEDEITEAWTNLPSSSPIWLYWDIDLYTGKRTFGYTNIKPSSGNILPEEPFLDQHFFDLTDNTMKVWSGAAWEEKIRLFATEYNGGQTAKITRPFRVNNSQVGLNRSCEAGYILFDENFNPLKSGNKFITTDSILSTFKDFSGSSLGRGIINGNAVAPIPMYYCIQWADRDKSIKIAKSTDLTYNECIGIAIERFGRNQNRRFITEGYIEDKVVFNWDEPPNTNIFVGEYGEITAKPTTKHSIQRIGYIVNRHTIYVKLSRKHLINPPY